MLVVVENKNEGDVSWMRRHLNDRSPKYSVVILGLLAEQTSFNKTGWQQWGKLRLAWVVDVKLNVKKS